ncbi:hypothetical protein B0T17DRAFT_505619 [Bombardia bombarda]|uniref:Uncharacterized protein n=1 Tax=Bombardia bombarda TaxID=252184 RepID=A0AA40C902_9PEZI|nr:hypothetical protein B0T17DRAFT_505619 [Bombardia bombarda]
MALTTKPKNQKKTTVTATKTEGAMQVATETPITLTLRAWYYTSPEKLAEYTLQLANFFRKQKLPAAKPRWEISVQSPPYTAALLNAAEGPLAFVPLEINFQTGYYKSFLTTVLHRANTKPDVDLFDDLFRFLSNAMKGPKFNKAISLEKPTLICWSLWDPYRKPADFGIMSRSVLTAPGKPIDMPAERIEQALYHLVRLRIRAQDKAVPKGADGHVVMETIENQLYNQKLKFTELTNLMDAFTATTNEVPMTEISANIKALEAVDKALSTLLGVVESHVGRKPLPNDNSRIVRVFKYIFMKKFADVAIDSKTVEELKKNARRELSSFQRTSPILAGHIRLSRSANWQQLQQLCDLAAEGPEKSEMPQMMSITPCMLDQPEYRAASLKRARKYYEEQYHKVIAQIELLNKAIGVEYVRCGESIMKASVKKSKKEMKKMARKEAREAREAREKDKRQEKEQQKVQELVGREAEKGEVDYCEKV